MEEVKEETEPKISGFLIRKNQVKKQLQIRVNSIKQKIAKEFDKPQKHIHDAEDEVDHLIRSLEVNRNNEETWIYVDMDMFYASIEIRDDPSIADKPVAVTNGTVLSTSNYIARRYGVKSAMPEFQAVKLCPSLVLVQQNMDKYRAENEKIKLVFKEYDPNYEEIGLDEAGLHVTKVIKKRCADTDAGKQALAAEIRQKIFTKTNLTSSAGIGCNKMIAKVCSKVNKPNGQFYLKGENAKDFMKNVEITAVSGITQQDGKLLELLGIKTCGDILKKKLELFFGLGQQLLTNSIKCALGLGPTEHLESHKAGKKSFSVSKSFDPTDDEGLVEEKLTELTDMLDSEFRRKKVKAKGIEVSLKTFAYEFRTRREMTKSFFSSGNEVNELALTMLRMLYPLEVVRALSIRIGMLRPDTGKVQKKKPVDNKKKYATSEFESMFVNTSIIPQKSNVSSGSGLKIIRFECERCGSWLTGTDTQMNFHLQVCPGYNKPS